MPGIRILVVDDEATIRALLKCAVAAPGVQLFDADCAEKALEAAAQNAPFDLVITDVMMPGIDGVELANRLRAAGQATKFLFISGYCDVTALTDRIAGLHANFLGKPFNIPELVRVVHAMLTEAPGEPRPLPVRRRASH